MDNIIFAVFKDFSEGNWNGLCSYKSEDFSNIFQKCYLALMCCYGCLQSNRLRDAKVWACRAIEWGATEEQLTDLLLCNAEACLNEASILLGFKRKVESSISALGSNLFLDIIAKQNNFKYVNSGAACCTINEKKFVARQIKKVELVEGWAGNTVNTSIFRYHGILTWQNYQVTAFYIDSKRLRVLKRDLSTEEVVHYDLTGDYNLQDAHNSISLGVDRLNQLHICYDHHESKLKYRRSQGDLNIFEWSSEIEMSGKYETNVTYPTFILPKAGMPLKILYRDGHWKAGKACMKYYQEEIQDWIDYPEPIFDGAGNRPWTSNAYWNSPAVDINGTIHLTLCWRTDYFDELKTINNLNIDYAKSFSGGASWVTSRNRRLRLPITPVNSETIRALGPGENLMNQTSMAIDSKGNPHLVYYANDEFGIPQYQHLWFDGIKWLNSIEIGRASCRERVYAPV